MKIKVGDIVLITSGKDKGKKGKVLRTFAKKSTVVVEGCNIEVKHRKPYSGQAGQRIVREGELSVGKVALCNAEGQVDRIGYKKMKDGSKVRMFRKSGQVVSSDMGVAASASPESTKSKPKKAAKK